MHTKDGKGQHIAVDCRIQFFFIVGDSDGVGDDSEHGDEDEVEEEEPEDAAEALTEAVEGEDVVEKEAGDEFVDKEHESQFCLETNFTDEGGQEETESTAEQEDSKGTEIARKNSVQITILQSVSSNISQYVPCLVF